MVTQWRRCGTFLSSLIGESGLCNAPHGAIYLHARVVLRNPKWTWHRRCLSWDHSVGGISWGWGSFNEANSGNDDEAERCVRSEYNAGLFFQRTFPSPLFPCRRNSIDSFFQRYFHYQASIATLNHIPPHNIAAHVLPHLSPASLTADNDRYEAIRVGNVHPCDQTRKSFTTIIYLWTPPPPSLTINPLLNRNWRCDAVRWFVGMVIEPWFCAFRWKKESFESRLPLRNPLAARMLTQGNSCCSRQGSCSRS